MTLNVLTLSTLFPDVARPAFGVFVERQTRELAARDGVSVTVIAPIGLPPFPLSLHKHYARLRHLPLSERWKDMTVHRPRFRLLPRVGARFTAGAMTRAIWPLVRRLHAERPFDVIDASFFWPDGPVAQRLAKRLGIPYSVKARGADIHHWGRHPATRKAVRRAGQQAGGLLAVSSAMRAGMAKLGMDADKIRVHYTGVDLDRFTIIDSGRAKEGLGVSGPVVLAVGALIPRKGQHILIGALRWLPGVTLLLAGHGSHRSEWERLATRLGVADRVGFLGSVMHERLPHLLAAADVMALPSASEGLANAWVEALACGTPIVITDVGGARELMDRPEAGHIVERTPKAFADAITAILASPPDRGSVRETVKRFTWAANGEALEAHLRQVAGK